MDVVSNSRDYLLYQQYLNEKKVFDFNKEREYWGNLPITSPFLKPLYSIFKKGMTFLDLGCGAGNVLRYADNIGYTVKGVEFNSKLLLYTGQYETEVQDIRKLKENIYESFDVIYSYKPIKKGFDSYLNKVINNMKKGSYILTPAHHIENKKVTLVDSFLNIKN